MLLDKYLPEWDVTEIHTIKIKAAPEAAYRAMMDVTLSEINGMVSFLFNMRMLPEKLAGRKGNGPSFDAHKSLLAQMMNNGFVKIEENSPREIVFGLIVPGSIGRVWKKDSDLDVTPEDAKQYLAFNNPDFCRVVANFLVKETDTPGTVLLYTESRTQGMSQQAFQSFRLYWAIIRPWSGLIRRMMLRGAKRRAEKLHV